MAGPSNAPTPIPPKHGVVATSNPISEKEWNALLDISQKVNSSLDLDVVLAQTLEMVGIIVQVDASSIWLVDEQKQELYCATATGPQADAILHHRMPWDQGIVGWTVQNDQFYITNEAFDDEHHAVEIAERIGYECRSLLCVPMHSRGRVTGCIEVINKHARAPFADKDLLQISIFANLVGLAIENANAFLQVQQENVHLRRELGDRRIEPGQVIANASEMRQVMEMVERIAPTDSTVLIRGESGTGKEVVAQSLHGLSHRARGPFVAINCGGIPENLLESELFGHEKGAYTGATSRRIGRFELAHGGTLFLDEIGDMPPPLQVKLLRVLQSRRFERLGGNTMIEADVRIVAATNQDLEELVRGGGFREDLYYRLNVIALFLPPLRDRGEDILPLASYFLQDIGARIHRPAKVFHPDAVELLLSHGWPGNIRELENAIEHAVVLARTPEVQVTDLPFNVQASRVVVRETLDVPASLDEAQRQFRQRHIRDALNRYGGNRTRAAEALGLQRTYLSRLIKELDIDDA